MIKDPLTPLETPQQALDADGSANQAAEVPTEAPSPDEIPQDIAPASTEPSDKEMGVVELTLDKGVDVRAYGKVYALDYTIQEDGCEIDLTIDYYNRRLKVLNFEGDLDLICRRLDYLATKNQFDKIFIKATAQEWQGFLAHGYMLEGLILHYFSGENAYVVSRFLSRDRISSPTLLEESALIQELMSRPRAARPLDLPEGYTLAIATEDDIPGLVILYSHVFASYPSPLTMPDYLLSTMRRNLVYAVIKDPEGNIVSAASADLDVKHSNAEMTDCATFSAERGKGLMRILLVRLEQELVRRGIRGAYTLARANAPGMNKVFYDLTYEYCGRLINNCDISGGFEDINIWSKKLS
jgi:putative beta-lysine N-acetyltransferase